jgi:hypothetical protein
MEIHEVMSRLPSLWKLSVLLLLVTAVLTLIFVFRSYTTNKQYESERTANTLASINHDLPEWMVLRDEVQIELANDEQSVVVTTVAGTKNYVPVYSKMLESWKVLLDTHRSGGKLYYFDSPKEDWDNLAGSRGYVLIREGRIVDVIVIFRN